MSHRVVHAFSVDVEEYFQVNAFDGTVARSEWDTLPSRVAGSVDLLLDLLEMHEARATFFVLGCLVARHGGLIRRIHSAGHEIASHGWSHRKLTAMSPAQFREEVRTSKEALEWTASAPVVGFRAPSFSLIPGYEWAFDVLLEEGYRYDSSLFPIRRPGYGYAAAIPRPHALVRASGVLAEFPMTVWTVGRMQVPAAGGGYFRHFPYAVTRAALRACERRATPGMFYIHPWEVDPLQPRLSAPPLQRLRHYGGIEGTPKRLVRLLREFRFTTAAHLLFRDGARSSTLVPALVS